MDSRVEAADNAHLKLQELNINNRCKFKIQHGPGKKKKSITERIHRLQRDNFPQNADNREHRYRRAGELRSAKTSEKETQFAQMGPRRNAKSTRSPECHAMGVLHGLVKTEKHIQLHSTIAG